MLLFSILLPGKLRLKHVKRIVRGLTASECQNRDLNSRSLITKPVLLNTMSPTKPDCPQIEKEIEIIQEENGNKIFYDLFSAQQSQNPLWNINLIMPLTFSKPTCNKTQIPYSQPSGPAGLWPLDAFQSHLPPWLIMPLPPTSFISHKPANAVYYSSLLECTATDIYMASSSILQVFSKDPHPRRLLCLISLKQDTSSPYSLPFPS